MLTGTVCRHFPTGDVRITVPLSVVWQLLADCVNLCTSGPQRLFVLTNLKLTDNHLPDTCARNFSRGRWYGTLQTPLHMLLRAVFTLGMHV